MNLQTIVFPPPAKTHLLENVQKIFIIQVYVSNYSVILKSF